MAVTIGSARIDECGKATGGQAGDQTKKEVSTQSWYNSSKGWRVFRANSPEARKKIATCMKAACANDHIGYDQAQRNSLYTAAEPYGFDVSKVTKDVETDCSALVRVCCAFAGITGLPSGFRTTNEPSNLLKTGAFTELTGDKYTKQSAYLAAGDILCTRTQGHTVVVLTDGPKVEANVTATVLVLGDRTLQNGCCGTDVKELQTDLIQLGYSCGSWGADGDFGDCTELTVRSFQTDMNLEVDGIVGQKTLEAIIAALSATDTADARSVLISGGNCYVRTEPNTNGRKLGVAYAGNRLSYERETSPEGWHKVAFNNQSGWVSGKYGKVE